MHLLRRDSYRDCNIDINPFTYKYITNAGIIQVHFVVYYGTIEKERIDINFIRINPDYSQS